jgi:hypothetical protein
MKRINDSRHWELLIHMISLWLICTAALESGRLTNICVRQTSLARVLPSSGWGRITEICRNAGGRNIMPVVAVMTAASSGARLTKYSNITDPVDSQKKWCWPRDIE